MDAVQIGFDTRLFSADVVVRAAHRYTADYSVDLKVVDTEVVVSLTPRRDELCTQSLSERLRNDVLDELLREKVRSETAALQATLAQAALLGATPRLSEGPGQ